MAAQPESDHSYAWTSASYYFASHLHELPDHAPANGCYQIGGSVSTPFGIVAVRSSEWPTTGRPLRTTQLEFVRDGRVFTRWYKRTFAKRYLITLARRFAREIVEKNP